MNYVYCTNCGAYIGQDSICRSCPTISDLNLPTAAFRAAPVTQISPQEKINAFFSGMIKAGLILLALFLAAVVGIAWTSGNI